jgi:glycosyltransferase involved in cell wall biosynthesis
MFDSILDYKVHDFYAICPSQHLMDLHGRYCGVPANHGECNHCLKKNPAAYWASSRPVDIAEWRNSFAKLFDAADMISVFDPSSVEILQKAFQLDDKKLRLIPHHDGYFKCDNPVMLSNHLHIGVLGTLIAVKGAAIINGLVEYLVTQKMHIPITVVGQSLVPTLPNIRVLGPYENDKLPEIINREGINVILMPTVVPETFSYTISEAIKMGLPIVAFDIGAQGTRLKQYELGKVVPLNASSGEILAAIQSVFNLAKESKK